MYVYRYLLNHKIPSAIPNQFAATLALELEMETADLILCYLLNLFEPVFYKLLLRHGKGLCNWVFFRYPWQDNNVCTLFIKHLDYLHYYIQVFQCLNAKSLFRWFFVVCHIYHIFVTYVILFRLSYLSYLCHLFHYGFTLTVLLYCTVLYCTVLYCIVL